MLTLKINTKGKEYNKKSGASPEFSPFYNDFYEISSGRLIFEMDMVKEVGVSSEDVVEEWQSEVYDVGVIEEDQQ